MPRKKAAEAAGTAEKKPPRRRKPAAGKEQRPQEGPEGQPASLGHRLRVKQVRSGIGHAETYRRTLRALGLTHYQDEVVVADTPSIRGMIRKVWHLVAARPEEA